MKNLESLSELFSGLPLGLAITICYGAFQLKKPWSNHKCLGQVYIKVSVSSPGSMWALLSAGMAVTKAPVRTVVQASNSKVDRRFPGKRKCQNRGLF